MEPGGVLPATGRGNVKLASRGMPYMTLPVPLAVEPGYVAFATDLGHVMLAVGWGEKPAGDVMGLDEWEHVRAAVEQEKLDVLLVVELA